MPVKFGLGFCFGVWVFACKSGENPRKQNDFMLFCHLNRGFGVFTTWLHNIGCDSLLLVPFVCPGSMPGFFFKKSLGEVCICQLGCISLNIESN